ncbi:MAG: TadE/TadG family type IV pilus assembly protein [Actinomycetota bacterium]|nr:TadE/TadG family type IV pilus assembly protein [Actinomycetota bacterium]
MSGERGNAVVEFALVAPMLIAVALAVMQLALTFHVRSTLTAAAAEGARVAALAGSQLSTGERRARELLDGNLAASVVTSVHATRVVEHGIVMTRIQIGARLPLLGMLGPESMSVTAHALQEHT